MAFTVMNPVPTARPARPRKASKTGPIRDTQKSKVYSAEDAASKATTGTYHKQTIANGDLQAWVDTVLIKPTIRRRWPHLGKPGGIKVRLKRGGSAYGKPLTREIMLPLFARNEWVILHEMAHIMVGASNDHAWHGPEFARVLLFLVEQALGQESAEAYKAACKEKRVKIAPATYLPKPQADVKALKVAAPRTLARLEKADADAAAALRAARLEYDRHHKALLDYKREHAIIGA